MLMFQYGLMSTFIPEILMLIAYVACLFAPDMKIENTSLQINTDFVHVSTLEQTPISSSLFSNFDLLYSQAVVVCKQLALNCDVTVQENVFTELKFDITYGLSYVQFSRPPPFSLN